MELLKRSFRRRGLEALSVLGALVFGCVPDLDSDESTVSEPRVLAVQAEPAEAAPNQAVTYRVLYADPNEDAKGPEIEWYFCTAPKPLAELGPISQDCLRGSSGRLSKIGDGESVSATFPADACSLFGPNPPAPEPGQPPGRPADPDATGGYKLPVMLSVGESSASNVLLYEHRMFCPLGGVSPNIAVEFAQRYKRNTNPQITRFTIEQKGESVELPEDEVVEVDRDEELQLSVGWPACPESDVCGDGVCGPDETALDCPDDCATQLGCEGQERYLLFDRQARELNVERESMRVAWYASAGTFESERTGVPSDGTVSRSENTFKVPDQAGDLTLWAVLRDARGGVGFRRVNLLVR